MGTNATIITCEHEFWCSKPNIYCRYVEKVEMLDKYGNMIEAVEPGIEERDDTPITCVECGKEAWYDCSKTKTLI